MLASHGHENCLGATNQYPIAHTIDHALSKYAVNVGYGSIGASGRPLLTSPNFANSVLYTAHNSAE